jgi:hypothetical protein
MKCILSIAFLVGLTITQTGCSLDASIASLEDIATIFTDSEKNTLGVAPSQQHEAKDEFGQYRVQSAVGEVTAGEHKVTRGSKVYRTEISVTYQKM